MYLNKKTNIIIVEKFLCDYLLNIKNLNANIIDILKELDEFSY